MAGGRKAWEPKDAGRRRSQWGPSFHGVEAPHSTHIPVERPLCNLAVLRLKSCVLKRMIPLCCPRNSNSLRTQRHLWWQRQECPKLWGHTNWLSTAEVKVDFHCWQKMWEALKVACDGSLFTFFSGRDFFIFCEIMQTLYPKGSQFSVNDFIDDGHNDYFRPKMVTFTSE